MRTSFVKRLKITYIRVALVTIVLAAFFLPSYVKFESTGDNIFDVYVNGELVGQTGKKDDAEVCVTNARKNLAKKTDGLLFMEIDLRFEGKEVLYGEVSTEEELIKNMENVLAKHEQEMMKRAYTVKIKDYTANLGSIDEVEQMLQAAIDKYDTTGQYRVQLKQDLERELNVMTADVYSLTEARVEAMEERQDAIVSAANLPEAGIFAAFSEIVDAVEVEEEKDLSEYNRGLIQMNFGDMVEVVECYMPASNLSSLEVAIEDVTKEQETNKIYEVVSGDTLGEIAETHNMPVDALLAMNPVLEDQNSMIRIGDELIISVPEPELSVLRQEELYYEEDYNADVIYVDNDEWYTTDKVTLQQPSAGHRRVVAIVSYRNNEVVNTEILKEDIQMEAVPKIVERGTKIPPTYIKPISGGRLSSNFGGRKAPKRGASTNHKGIDWAVPTGTAIMASCGGTVTKAGWASGYGYVVYIKHPDGRETRYGHCSKVLVSVGQQVSQGQKIALSGNTGNSTGPHLHFEIRIHGVAVNPLNYLS